jgi:2'-5' RNA ligase
MRLFTGIAVPQRIGATLSGYAHRLSLPGLRFTTLENLHLTLYFLGQVDDERLADIRAAMDHIQVVPMQLTIRRLGTFSRSGVLFAEVDLTPVLTELQGKVAAAMVPFATRPDPNSPPLGDYHPHITLARTRSALRLRPDDLAEFHEPIRFEADSVNLYQSRPTPAGSRYEVLHTAG